MTPFFTAFTFVNVWFVSMFIAMPIMRGRGVWWTVLVNTLMAAAVTGMLYAVVRSDLLPLRGVYQ